MKILKFGGSSVATPERIIRVIGIVKGCLGKEPLAIVFSAFGGVTDQLVRISKLALAGNSEYKGYIKELESRHLEAADILLESEKLKSLQKKIKSLVKELDDVVHGIFLVKELTLGMLDFVMSFGERLSTMIIAESFEEKSIPCDFLDARRVIRTNSNFGKAKVNFDITNSLIVEHFKNNSKNQLVTGFIATSSKGETTTLGRSGSDYTAAILASALKASALEIWTDVDGMMSADPNRVKKSIPIEEMTYEEAMELSHFGAKVIFPSTMQPAILNQIPIWIKNTFNPSFSGTLITERGKIAKSDTYPLVIKGISSLGKMSLLNVQGVGLQDITGVSKRLFGVLAEQSINVVLISQASSEHSICFSIETIYSEKARLAIEEEFYYEINAGEMEKVIQQDSMAIVAIVGEKMRNNPGISGRMFNALGKDGINIYAIAQGSSELNISAVILESDTSKALNSLHDAFFLSDRRVVNIFLVGTGWIGKELIKIINDQFEVLSEAHRLEVNVVAVGNSRKMLVKEDGLDTNICIEELENKGKPMNLSKFKEGMITMNLSNSIFVDCTASNLVVEEYESILESNVSIVTPNKKANSGSMKQYNRLKELSLLHGGRFLFETNVGAGLPIITTLNDLLFSGDKVIHIEAVLSGSLNFIFSSVSKNMTFSQVVRRAKDNGFTEPDPRDDLGGMDVARKILILSRETGLSLELSDVKVKGLIPTDCEGDISVEEFFEKLKGHDSDFERQRLEAEKQNSKLRYCAVLKEGHATVELITVDQSHPFYSLNGTDNVISITTERYNDQPLVIRGPGAGAGVTAAGVLADIIRIGNYVVR